MEGTHKLTLTHTAAHLCCAVHNKSRFIKARSHPLSVYNHRSRLNRWGNTIPFRFGVVLIYELVFATLVCSYELGKTPTAAQYCNGAFAEQIAAPRKQLVANCADMCAHLWTAVCSVGGCQWRLFGRRVLLISTFTHTVAVYAHFF